ncbi:MAG TPA: deoxynucleoside kinase [Anaerolineae bacterium]|nr:deoxynucleoside kinase [Anaerolineae bacterium]
MNKRFIAIAGNVGVGKSTLTRMLAARLGWEPFFEAVDDNPYLADFYQDMPRWAFHSQIFFLSRRLRHHHELLQREGSVIQDRSVYEDAEVFARNLYEQGAMGERDYRSYRELYEVLCAFLPPPDLVIYLRADVDTLLARIRMRGRAYEQDIDPAYLARLNQLYDAWIEGFTLSPVLTIEAASMDFVAHKDHLDRIEAAARDRLADKDALALSNA